MLHLRIILSNLINNAIKYRDISKPQSFIFIGIETNLNSVNIKIKDNGIGINATQIPKLTQMFYRAHEGYNGTGLGLYILSDSLKMLKGDLKIESSINEGSTFEIIIPNFEVTESL